MAKRAAVKVDFQDEAVKLVLATLLAEFRQKNFTIADLQQTYQGMPPAELKNLCCADGRIDEVDYDLAFQNLIEADLVKTGPMDLYDNKDSSVFILAFFSKNEFSYLTEAGYRAANRLGTVRPAAPRPIAQTVHISASTFNHSPVGVGHQVTQQQTIGMGETDQHIARLAEAVQTHIADADKRSRVLTILEGLRAAPDKPSRLERYTQLMGILSDHITVFTPLLTPLLISLTT